MIVASGEFQAFSKPQNVTGLEFESRLSPFCSFLWTTSSNTNPAKQRLATMNRRPKLKIWIFSFPI
jgi:hypothetical protein